ncbi:MAG: guanylate kinase [Clostridium sp.]|nr:guanylate kinase [Clostridium sp.]
MGKIFYLMGKSATGKDTLYKRLLEAVPELNSVVHYTTRPMREGEQEGREYHFVTGEKLRELARSGRVIESRTYDTVAGPWTYATVDDGTMDAAGSVLMIGTLESYVAVRAYFGSDRLVPLYIESDDGDRLARALKRERKQEHPRYAEVCRRFLADEEDFSEENLEKAGITVRYRNENLEDCLSALENTIRCDIL